MTLLAPDIGFDSDRNEVTIVTPTDTIAVPEASKLEIAQKDSRGRAAHPHSRHGGPPREQKSFRWLASKSVTLRASLALHRSVP